MSPFEWRWWRFARVHPVAPNERVQVDGWRRLAGRFYVCVRLGWCPW